MRSEEWGVKSMLVIVGTNNMRGTGLSADCPNAMAVASIIISHNLFLYIPCRRGVF